MFSFGRSPPFPIINLVHIEPYLQIHLYPYISHLRMHLSLKKVFARDPHSNIYSTARAPSEGLTIAILGISGVPSPRTTP